MRLIGATSAGFWRIYHSYILHKIIYIWQVVFMRSSIRVRIRIFTLRSKNLEQRTRKEEVEKHWNNSTMEQFNNGRKKEEAGSGDWQCPALPCRRNEITLLQLSLILTPPPVFSFKCPVISMFHRFSTSSFLILCSMFSHFHPGLFCFIFTVSSPFNMIYLL